MDCPECGTDLGPVRAIHLMDACYKVQKENHKKLKEEYAALKKAHDANLMAWEVREREFVTTREAKIIDELAKMKAMVHVARAQLDERNEATKVWIQADTQARKYCHELENHLTERGCRCYQRFNFGD